MRHVNLSSPEAEAVSEFLASLPAENIKSADYTKVLLDGLDMAAFLTVLGMPKPLIVEMLLDVYGPIVMLDMIAVLDHIERVAAGKRALASPCTEDHSKVEVRCKNCGWHRHSCRTCGRVWEHDGRLMTKEFKSTYKAEHMCCGVESLDPVRR